MNQYFVRHSNETELLIAVTGEYMRIGVEYAGIYYTNSDAYPVSFFSWVLYQKKEVRRASMELGGF